LSPFFSSSIAGVGIRDGIVVSGAEAEAGGEGGAGSCAKAIVKVYNTAAAVSDETVLIMRILHGV
jgi:hypothetical protein